MSTTVPRSTAPSVIWLADCTADVARAVGGKSRGLHDLIVLDLAVPDGFAVTTDAYRAAVSAAGIEQDIADSLVHTGTPAADRAASARIAELFDTLVMPEETSAAVRAALESLGDGPVAVRSSAIAEDREDASFAGQQETELWITGADEVERSIVRCWASLFSPQAIGYRARIGVAPDDVAIAVVVQQMVPAVAAGVAMTLDPTTGQRDVVYVESALGLGEGVVRGDVATDRYTIAKETGVVVHSDIGNQRQAHLFVPDEQAVRLVDIAPSAGDAPSIGEKTARQVADLAIRIEAAAGHPMDIEWAVGQDGQVRLLQGRPETVWSHRTPTTPPRERSARPGPTHRPSSDAVSWTTGNVGEAVPGVLTPLTYTFWARPFEQVVRGSYGEMGVISGAEGRKVTESTDEIALGVVYGRAVLNVNLTLSVGAGLPGTNAAEVAANILGDTTEDIAYLPKNTPARYPVVAVKLPLVALRLRRRMLSLEEDVLAAWRIATETADPESARRQLPAVRAQFTEALTTHSHATFLSSAMFEPLSGVVGNRPEVLTDLLSGYGGMFEVQMLHQLWEVANDRRELGSWLAHYGYLAPYAGNLRSRSWREDPAPLDRLRDTYRSVGEADAPGAIEHTRVAARLSAERELLAHVSTVKRPGVRLLLKLAGHFIPLREVGKNMYLRAVDAARALVRLIGEDLATRGVLDDAEDVWFLTYDELLGDLPDGIADIIAERRDEHAWFETLTVPDLFAGCPTPRARTAPAESATDGELVLRGVGASGGVVEARARVVSDPTDDGESLQPGEVLVAAATDPSWTTLFVGAAAVVTDLGGALSHGAIVARELGLPCVTNVRTGTAQIRTGDLVRVDGAAGTVTRL